MWKLKILTILLNTLKYLTFGENCHFYTRWDDDGSLLF